MASRSDNFSQYGRMLICSICQGIFSKPKALPCMHTYCEDCLREYVCSRSYDAVGQFPCPICQQLVGIPATGVEAYRDNFYIASILDSFAAPQQQQSRRISFHRDGESTILCFGFFGNGPTDLTSPVNLVVTKSGYIVVSDRRENRILTFDICGFVRAVFACPERINCVAVSGDDTILVTNSEAGRPLVIEYDVKGTRLRAYGSLNQLESTHGIAVLCSPFQVVASAPETSTLLFMNSEGRLVQKFSSRATFGQPYHLASNGQNEVIVSDFLNHCVKVFDRQGKMKLKFGGIGIEKSSLCEPLGICLDAADNIVVADSGNHSVKVFSSSGKFLTVAVDLKSRGSTISAVKPIGVATAPAFGSLIVLISVQEFTQIQVHPYRIPAPASCKSLKKALHGCHYT